MPNDTVTASHPHSQKNGMGASQAVVHSHAGVGGRVEGLVWVKYMAVLTLLSGLRLEKLEVYSVSLTFFYAFFAL